MCWLQDIRLRFFLYCIGTNESNLVIRPVKVGFLQTEVTKALLYLVISISKKDNLPFSSRT